MCSCLTHHYSRQKCHILEFKLQLFTYYLDYTKRLIKLVEGMRDGKKGADNVIIHVQTHTESNFTDVDVSFF